MPFKDIKDIAYISGYIASVACLIAGFRYRIKKVEDTNATIKKVIFEEKGGLNVVTISVLREKIKGIDKAIDQEKKVNAKTLEKVDCMNENLIIIMTHMELKPIRTNRRSES